MATSEHKFRPAADGHRDEAEAVSGLLPVENLTSAAREGRLPLFIDTLEVSTVFDQLARALYRTEHAHVLITGQKGVGKTATIREFARRSATGSIPFLRDQTFIWIDCQDVAPEDSRACLEAILSSFAGRQNTVLCLDGLASLLRRPLGGTNKSFLRAALNRAGLRVIGVLSRWEYNDLIGNDADLADFFTRIEIEEPREVHALQIISAAASGLSCEFGLKILPEAVERAAMLGSSYILSACQPAKSIRIIRRACENVHYEVAQLAKTREAVNASDVVSVVSHISGIPERTLSGNVESDDFEAMLGDAVLGQDLAVQTVATELRFIKSGLNEPAKPATVMLFAGLTGVGKTELAKRIAEIYSTSKRLQVYTMGNFTEPHSVSGIIGVPAGYVGHEAGGRLINDLISDPYSVFLLDEAEKAHPNVWKPFLNLFDEGWIVDQRGIKAYADRAVFILTTNAGGESIQQMTQTGKSRAEIEERIKAVLSKVRHERSSQPVFSPHFLARLRRIVVFEPLSEAAMIAIATKSIQNVLNTWWQKRQKHIIVSDKLIRHIGRSAFAINFKSGGQEGGRIVRRLIADLVEDPIQRNAAARTTEYQPATTIEVQFESGEETLEETCESLGPKTIVVFR